MKSLLKSALAIVVMAAMTLGVQAQTKKTPVVETVVYKAEIHCNDCKSKIEKAIPFEKGVKDLTIDMKAQTVTVKYDPAKTNKANLQKAFDKMKIKVEEAKMCCADPSKPCTCKGGECEKGTAKTKECKEGKCCGEKEHKH